MSDYDLSWLSEPLRPAFTWKDVFLRLGLAFMLLLAWLATLCTLLILAFAQMGVGQ